LLVSLEDLPGLFKADDSVVNDQPIFSCIIRNMVNAADIVALGTKCLYEKINIDTCHDE
jgi:hypothetical protein